MPEKNKQETMKNDVEVGMGVNINFVFFGTSDASVSVLEDLKKKGHIPKVVVTTIDKPQGRKFVITPSPVKVWAGINNVKILQPQKLDADFVSELKKETWDLFIVVAYGKIIPKEILDIPTHKSLNVHYSLLPKLRGSSPIEGAILQDEKNTGVSIILMDEKMDHGPVIAEQKIEIPVWPPKRTELMNNMNSVAGLLLSETIPKWINAEIVPKEQNHDEATFVKMIKKEDALLTLSEDPYLNYRKIMAYEKWPRAYFIENNKRVIVNEAVFTDGKLDIKRVTPEGKKEMSYSEYLKRKI